MIGFWADLFTFLQVAIALFLIFIIMLQRGKGGGLVGALGGMGGASAFGPKADVQVLKLTIGLAFAWVVVACAGIFFNRSYTQYNTKVDPKPAAKKEADDKKTKTGDTPTKDKTKNEVGATGSDKSKSAASEKGKATDEKNPFEDSEGEAKKKPAAPAKDKPASTPAGTKDAKADAEKPAAKTETEKK